MLSRMAEVVMMYVTKRQRPDRGTYTLYKQCACTRLNRSLLVLVHACRDSFLMHYAEHFAG